MPRPPPALKDAGAPEEETIDAPADETPLHPDFVALAAKMPATVRSILVDGADPSTVSTASLISELGISARRHLVEQGAQPARVLHVPSILGADACAALRSAVDAQRSTRVDSVDGAAEYQLPLSLAGLRSIVGDAAVSALCALPTSFRHVGHADADGAGSSRAEGPSDIFVRRYTSGERPWNPFHHDSAALTINCALSDDAAVTGGRLVAVVDGRALATITRAEGDATVHDSRLLHAVTRMGSGVRYSLILFFGHAHERCDDDDEAATFSAFIASLEADEREAVLSDLKRLEAPTAHALIAAERRQAEAYAEAGPSKRAVERARAGVSAASAALLEAQRALERSQAELDEALRSAQRKKAHHFQAQVHVQSLKVELTAIRREARSQLMAARGVSLVARPLCDVQL